MTYSDTMPYSLASLGQGSTMACNQSRMPKAGLETYPPVVAKGSGTGHPHVG